MRAPVDASAIRAVARELGREARQETRAYLTGGATAVLRGWRATTLDIDLRLEPESDELLRALGRVKDALGVNIELTSPPDFIPEVPGWRERSPFVLHAGRVYVHHFDPYSQALSKIERGFAHDLADVESMLRDGLISGERLRELLAQVEPALFRYPALDAASFRAKVERAVG